MSVAVPKPGHVVIYSTQMKSCDVNDGRSIQALLPGSHESMTRTRMGEKLAALKNSRFSGEYDATKIYVGDKLYFVPVDTLISTQARMLGIHNEEYLFGGVVPYPFVATKSITHPLVHPDAAAPEGWTASFPLAVANIVLEGYSAFSIEDARAAAEKLLSKNSVRIKPALGIGGGRQHVISRMDELPSVLEKIHPEELALCGVVLEQNLNDVTTYSIGQVHVGGLRITYYGTQHLTKNHHGKDAYGGSELHIVRGNFDALRQLKLPPDVRRAVDQAYQYDTAANVSFPGFFASRRNYDVAQGIDDSGDTCSGVLEQSWRLGGASSAEIAALEAFAGDPDLRAVRASSWERYDGYQPPPHADVYFRGRDPHVGELVKYSTIDSYEYFTE